MKIYLDVVFLINFFFDFVLLFGTKYILKEQTKLFKLALGSLIGGCSIFFLFLNITTFTLFILKIIISTVMILISFGSRGFLKKYAYFYILSIFLGGVMYLLNITFSYKNKGLIFFSNGLSINLFVMLILTPIIIYLYVKEARSYKNNYSNCYQVDIYINKVKYCLKGYLDTGNTICDNYKKRSVILLDLNKLNITNQKIIYVPFKTINGTGAIKCIVPDKVVIKENTYTDLLLGNIKEKFNLENSSCILPNKIKEDLC